MAQVYKLTKDGRINYAYSTDKYLLKRIARLNGGLLVKDSNEYMKSAIPPGETTYFTKAAYNDKIQLIN